MKFFKSCSGHRIYYSTPQYAGFTNERKRLPKYAPSQNQLDQFRYDRASNYERRERFKEMNRPMVIPPKVV